MESAAGSIAAGLGPSLPSPQKTLAAPALEPGPSGALGALGLLPLISGTSQRASDLAPPTIGDAAEAAKRLFAFRTAPPPLQDEIFDTAAQGGTPPAPNHLAVERARKEERKVRALLEFVVRSGRRLTLDIFIPNAALWQAFADDTFEGPGLKSIADYATVLNGFAEQLAIFLTADHHLFPALASNHFAPWSADAFSGITKNYAERAAAHAAARADDSGDDERGADGDGRALPIPPDKLDELLFAGLALPAEIQALTTDLAKAQAALAATPEPRNTRSAIRKRTGRTGGSDTQRRAAARAVAKLTRDLTAAKRNLGFISAIGLQFLQMARASTVFGASNHNSAGITGDLSFYEAPGEAQRMHYRVRFLKGWTYGVTRGPSGSTLPISYAGAKAVPGDPPATPPPGGSAPAAASPSRRAQWLDIIRAGLTSGALAQIIDNKQPRAGARLINSFLKSKGMGGYSSHSIRKAGVSMAMANGVSAHNIVHWVQWRDADQIWFYADNSYEVPPAWADTFTWMKDLPYQNA